MPNRRVSFGFTLPNRMPLMMKMNVEELFNLAVKAEESGCFDSIWVGDNILAKPRLESVAVLSALAARTVRVKLGTACMSSFPLRDPILLAAQWATLDHLSSGRVILGVCIGGSKGRISGEREFEQMGASVKDRVRLMREGIEVLRRLWSEGSVTYSGRHYQLDDVWLEPKPVQRPPPIWIAVHPPNPMVGENAYRRVARLADGWITTYVTPEEFRDGWEAIQRYSKEASRMIDDNLLYYNLNLNDDEEQAFRESKGFLDKYYYADFTRERIDLWTSYGNREKCIKKFEEFIDAGVKSITIRFTSPDQAGQMDRFIKEIAPSF